MNSAKNRWMRLRLESTLALPSNPCAILLKQTVCTLHYAMMNETKNFTLALFQPKRAWNMLTNSVLLIETLVFIKLRLSWKII